MKMEVFDKTRPFKKSTISGQFCSLRMRMNSHERKDQKPFKLQKDEVPFVNGGLGTRALHKSGCLGTEVPRIQTLIRETESS